MWLVAVLVAIPHLVGAAGTMPRPRGGWRMEQLLGPPQLHHPSVVATAPDGRIFVAEDPMDIRTQRADVAEGRVLCLHPDGRLTVFAEGLHAVFGLQYLEGRLYVLHNPRFTAFTDRGDHGGDPVDLIRRTNPNPWALDWNDHIPANFKLGMDGWFYLAVGDKGLYGARGTDGGEVHLHGGGVVRIRPDGSGLEVFATGLRNILDVAIDAEDGLFTFDNTDEHDWMGRVSHVIDGGFYGYPHDFIPRRPYTLWCLADVGAGAACGALVYEEDGLPPEYLGNLFLSDFGKRQVLRGQLVPSGATYRIRPSGSPGATPPEVAAMSDFEALFPEPPEDFRPVGICVDVDARGFLVCDWQHRDVKDANAEVGRLWRLTWTGPDTRTPRPSWWMSAALGRPDPATVAELLSGLAHPARAVRLTAQRRLAARVGSEPAARMALETLVSDGSAPVPARIHGLWALGARAPVGTIRGLVEGSDPALARQALRWLGEHGPAEAWSIAAGASGWKQGAAPVRLAAVQALGHLAAPGAMGALVEALDDPDGHVRFGAFTALRRLGSGHPERWTDIVAHLGDPRAPVRDGIRFALREVADPRLVTALLSVARNRDAGIPARQAAAELLAAVHHLPPEWDGSWWAYHPALQPPPARNRGWEGTPVIREGLLSLLADPDPLLRGIAARALGEMADADDRGTLRAALDRESDSRVREALVRALGTMPDAVTAGQLAGLLSREGVDAGLKVAILGVAPAFDHAGLAAAALVRMRDAGEPPEVRREAVRAVARMRPQGAIPALGEVTAAGGSLGVEAVAAVGEMAGDDGLELLVTAFGHADADLRAAAFTAAGRRRAEPLLEPLLRAWAEPRSRAGALPALARFRDLRAIDAWLDGLASRDAVLRAQCREAILGVRDAALPLLSGRSAGLSPVVLSELRTVYADLAGRDEARFLFEAHVPGIDDYERHALNGGGDAVRGQRLFFDAAGVACIRCHAVGGHGAVVGPDLTLIGAQFGRRELVEAVLYPARTVREGYQQYLIETRDGGIHAGAIRAESATAVVLLGADGGLSTLVPADIVRRESTPASLMPDGLHAGLSLEEFADLIAFLESRTSDPRQPSGGEVEPGFEPLIGSPDLQGWRELPEGTRRVDGAALLQGRPPEHWAVRDDRLVHDARAGDLWSRREFGDFELRLEWRWPDPPVFADFPVINLEGREVTEPDGRPVTERVLDAGDSGVLLRGLYRAQINLFCYPVGSGESWEYRTDSALTPEVRRALTPARAMDRPIGDWNQMRITLRGDRVTVWLNGETILRNALLPGIPERGPIGLQHEHGRIELRGLRVRELCRD